MNTWELRWRTPLLMAAAFGVVWSGLYAMLGVLHGMPGMFDAEFPFLLSSLMGLHNGNMAASDGVVWAFIDGAVVALVVGALFVRLYRGWAIGKEV